MADAAVSKTVEGQPHVGSTPTFGTRVSGNTHRAFPEGCARALLTALTAGLGALLTFVRLFLRQREPARRSGRGW